MRVCVCGGGGQCGHKCQLSRQGTSLPPLQCVRWGRVLRTWWLAVLQHAGLAPHLFRTSSNCASELQGAPLQTGAATV